MFFQTMQLFVLIVLCQGIYLSFDFLHMRIFITNRFITAIQASHGFLKKFLQPGQLLLLENLRFDPREEKNDHEFAKELASMAELYVSDAFGTVHRAHASTAGVAAYLPAYAGLLIEKELSVMGKALEDPKRPFVAILGGAKVSDKIGVINNLLEKADTIIIGGGPGGYTAALYAARAGLDTLVVERLSAGGQMALTHQIDNYPGFVDGIGGYELAEQMQRQAERFGAQTRNAQVQSVDLRGNPKVVETSEGTFYAKTVMLATGANPRELGLPEEKELVGRGVAYCAACDGMFYKGKTVVVVGGGNTAAADALLLSRIARKVVLVHRRDTLRATKIYHEPLMKAENVEFQWNSVVTALLHEDRLTGVRIRNVKTGEEKDIAADGIFISVGRIPATELVAQQLELDGGGYIVAGETTETNIPGVYAVGDVRTKPLRQVVTAVADGATAVHMAEEFLAGGV